MLAARTALHALGSGARALARPASLAAALPAASSSSAHPYQPTLCTRIPLARQPQSAREFTSSAPAHGAEDLVNIIYSTPDDPVAVVSIGPSAGFTLTDGLVVPAPILLVDGQCFLWDVAHPTQEGKDATGSKWDGWSLEKVKVFEALNPRPEILFVGTGTSTLFAPPAFKKYMNSLGIQVDVLASRNAASTYNLLQEEGRRVAAALYPISHLSARTGLVA
ncbi:hypothetical protein JCM3770_002653 [Rhodotorula araucariae]